MKIFSFAEFLEVNIHILSACAFYSRLQHVTSERARHMRFFVKVKFDKLYHRANTCSKFRPTALRCGDTALCLRSHHTPNNGEITVQRCCFARIWCFRILRVTWKSIKWTWAEPFKMNVKDRARIKFRC